jgi:hypothetical protein
MLLLRHRAKSRREPAKDREGEPRAVEECLLEVPAREGQAARWLDRDHLGDPRQAVEDGQLPEEIAGPKHGDLLAVADDPDGTVHHDKEARSDFALPGDDPIGWELDLDRPSGDDRQVCRCDAAEQPAGTEKFRPAILGERQDFLLATS